MRAGWILSQYLISHWRGGLAATRGIDVTDVAPPALHDTLTR